MVLVTDCPVGMQAKLGSHLAVYTPNIGVPSETFIRRHIEDLLPSKTTVICDNVSCPPQGNWSVACPVHCTTTPLHWRLGRLRGLINKGAPLPWGDPLLSFLRKHQVAVVLGEFMDQFLPVFRLLRETGVACYVHAHGKDVSASLRDESIRKAYSEYRDAEGIVTMSEFSRAALLAVGLPEDKVHVIPYGVDVPEIQRLHAQGSGEVRCLAVGRMTPKKAPLLLLKAFANACEDMPQLRLDFVGDGELIGAARGFIDEAGLGAVVTLHGEQGSSFVAQKMKTADIFVQHSITDPATGDMEGLPLAILEAMAHGVPVVATRHAGIPEQVVEGETGFLVDECDVEAMAESIVRMAQLPDLRRSMGEAGYLRAKEHFSWELNRKRLCELMNLEP